MNEPADQQTKNLSSGSGE